MRQENHAADRGLKENQEKYAEGTSPYEKAFEDGVEKIKNVKGCGICNDGWLGRELEEY